MMIRNFSPREKQLETIDRTLAAMHIWLVPALGANLLCANAAQGYQNLFGFGEYFMALQRHYIFSNEEE